MPNLQAQRPVAVSSPLAEDALLFGSMTASEELGRLYRFDLKLLSPDESLRMDDLLGQPLGVRLELPDGSPRHFNGLVSRFSQDGREGHLARYTATLRPWLWFLTRSADCRIFQGETVPDIVKAVFRGHGFTDFTEALAGTYRPRDYCTQYRETDFDFVSRLLEQEGIYYYFKHSEGKHTLVLADSYGAHESAPGYQTVPYFPPDAEAVRNRDHVSRWEIVREVQPGACALTDYDFERPRANLASRLAAPAAHAHSSLEIYDYPGGYRRENDGEARVRLRMEELEARFEMVRGEGDARGLGAGCLFTLSDYPREDQNREYLITSSRYEVSVGAYESGVAHEAGVVFRTSFTAIDARRTFRPARHTPTPVVQGPQTAVVVGKSGEEIWTDEYGRIKVQFHWDRMGQLDESSSCWVRVGQSWAGKGWGSIQIPRVGQEVVVDFLEGNPDCPIVTGSVYNADNRPPYDLPSERTMSGVRSASSPGGGGFNEIRFEDRTGEEEIYIHGQKNFTSVVENDSVRTVRNDDTTTVDANQTLTVGSNRTGDVGGDETLSVGGARSRSVGASETVSISSDQTLEIGASRTVNIGSGDTVTVGASREVSIGADRSLTISGSDGVTIGGSRTVTASGSMEISSSASITLSVGGSSIEITPGGININSAGPISILGAVVKVNS